MNILNKIENAINLLLLKLTALFLKLVPRPILKVFIRINIIWNKFSNKLKGIMPALLTYLKASLPKLKRFAATLNIKAKFTQTYQNALAQTKNKDHAGKGKFKKIFLTPYLIIEQWLNGLTAGQSMLLLTFTSASFLAIIGIGFSGHRMASNQSEASRMPASVEEIKYERPVYYKKETRHLSVTNFRLPVYIPKVNEVKSVDIDFTATISNRNAKKFLEKHEFHLRDFLILQVEPSIANFPLVDEGKEIIRDKILLEINEFLKMNKVEGEVKELKITYILAN